MVAVPAPSIVTILLDIETTPFGFVLKEMGSDDDAVAINGKDPDP
jgi:hypothetical protein